MALSLPSAYAAIDSIGGTSLSGQQTAGYAYAFPVVASTSGTIASIGVDWQGAETGNFRVALYSAGSGKPASLLASSADAPMIAGPGWQDLVVTGVSLNLGSTYWLALAVSVAKGIYYNAGSRSYYAKSYGVFDTTWNTASTQDSLEIANMRVTYTSSPDFSISASPPSQSVGAGGQISSTLTLASQGGYSGTVNLAVTSCYSASGMSCTLNGNPTAQVVGGTGTVTLAVNTLISTPAASYPVVVTATDSAITHQVTFTVTVGLGPQFNFNVKAGATQIVVTVTWTGSGTTTVAIVPPGGGTTIYDSSGVTYDRTSIAVVSGQQPAYTNIHRATFTSGSLWTSPASNQVWTLYVSGPSSFTVTVEVT